MLWRRSRSKVPAPFILCTMQIYIIKNDNDNRMRCVFASRNQEIYAKKIIKLYKKTPWSESTSELYRPSDHRLSAKWLPTFADKGCHVVSVTDPCGCILGFLDRSRYFFLSSSSSVVLTRLSGPRSRPTTFFDSAGNRTRASGPVAKNSDH
jgi:hypothetical protein